MSRVERQPFNRIFKTRFSINKITNFARGLNPITLHFFIFDLILALTRLSYIFSFWLTCHHNLDVFCINIKDFYINLFSILLFFSYWYIQDSAHRL